MSVLCVFSFALQRLGVASLLAGVSHTCSTFDHQCQLRYSALCSLLDYFVLVVWYTASVIALSPVIRVACVSVFVASLTSKFQLACTSATCLHSTVDPWCYSLQSLALYLSWCQCESPPQPWATCRTTCLSLSLSHFYCLPPLKINSSNHLPVLVSTFGS